MTRKEVILQAATHLFSQKGFMETSIADISQACGVATGTVFYHFKTKEELFLEVLASLKDGVLNEFERYSRERSFRDGLDMTEGVVFFYFILASEKEEWFLLLHRHYPYQLAEVNAVCRAHLEAIYNCFLDMFEQAILRGQADGSIGAGIARRLALVLFSMIDGIVRLSTLNLYEVGALCQEAVAACRRMLQGSEK